MLHCAQSKDHHAVIWRSPWQAFNSGNCYSASIHWTDNLFSFRTTARSGVVGVQGRPLHHDRLEVGGRPLMRATVLPAPTTRTHSGVFSIKCLTAVDFSRCRNIVAAIRFHDQRETHRHLCLSSVTWSQSLSASAPVTGLGALLSALFQDPETYLSSTIRSSVTHGCRHNFRNWLIRT